MSRLYDNSFYAALEKGSLVSAREMVPFVRKYLSPVNTVLDVGCGTGSWLKVWHESGVTDYAGIDGEYVDISRLKFPKEFFSAIDLTKEFNLNRKFDLVQCLEVAEHLEEKRADILIANITKHSDIIFFSAAPPGQGGQNHVNEQPYEYWRQKFAAHGFIAVDCLRPYLKNNKNIKPWYRFNSLIYIRSSAVERLSKEARGYIAPEKEKLRNYGDVLWHLRLMVGRSLPKGLMHAAGNWKVRITAALQR